MSTIQRPLSEIREPMPQVTSTGREHGLINVRSNAVNDSDGKRFKEKDREAMKKKRAYESEMVKVRYVNTKGKSDGFPKPYCRWDGDPILTYLFLPNHEYEIPRGLANEVNEHKEYQRSGLLDATGKKELLKDVTVQGEHLFVAVSF